MTCPSSSGASSRSPTLLGSRSSGVAEVFTPKDFGLNDIMVRFVEVVRASRGLPVDLVTPAPA